MAITTRVVAGAAAALWFSALAAAAQDVTLTAPGGGIAVSGQLRAYDGAYYRVETAYGLLTLEAADVDCAGPGCPDLKRFTPEIVIAGEPWPGLALIAPLVSAHAAAAGHALHLDDDLALRIASAERDELRVIFRPMPAGAAMEALAEEAATFALTLADPGTREGRLAAMEALVPVVAPDNPAERIGLDGLRGVAAGEIVNWRAFGGPDMPIALHALHDGHELQRLIDARIGTPPATAIRHRDPEPMAHAVARDPWALALLPASAAGGLRVLTLRDACGHLMRPTGFAVKAGDYPLAAALHLVSGNRRLPPAARALAATLATPAGQAAVAQAGLVDLRPEAQPVTDQGGRLVNAIKAAGPEVTLTDLQRLAGALAGAERLSLTFRFAGGTSGLDAASRSHAADLAHLLESGAFDGWELIFTGFSDGEGPAAANLALARGRAEAVRDAVLERAPMLAPGRVVLSVDAFGEALPMACDDTEVGRRINRRVELWLRPAPPDQPTEDQPEQP